jgi:hypothetical protein
MRTFLIIFSIVLFGCSDDNTHKSKDEVKNSDQKIKLELLSLERKWLDAEFALDTASIAPLLDSTFISISANGTSNKQMELAGIYKNISAMRADSIFLDSLELEDTIVNVYDNSAVVTFIVHTYKKEKGKPTEKRTRFYDVWINRNGNWKAVSSQGTRISNK